MHIVVKNLGLTNYEKTWREMKDFIASDPEEDEIWVTEHPPIFTTGVNKNKSVIPKTNIPHLFVDRGGKITYHGPGQLIIYTLINIKKNKINSYSKIDAPGVYTDEKKICSIGLRIKKNYAYHGLSLNVDMDTKPFTMIDPCGFSGLKMAQLSDFNIKNTIEKSGKEIALIINRKLNLHYEQNNKN